MHRRKYGKAIKSIAHPNWTLHHGASDISLTLTHAIVQGRCIDTTKRDIFQLSSAGIICRSRRRRRRRRSSSGSMIGTQPINSHQDTGRRNLETRHRKGYGIGHQDQGFDSKVNLIVVVILVGIARRATTCTCGGGALDLNRSNRSLIGGRASDPMIDSLVLFAIGIDSGKADTRCIRSLHYLWIAMSAFQVHA
eukprot:scaffold3119_cov92-Amphora_coffeaeformis.AAC.4